jgi:hypothetical protein
MAGIAVGEAVDLIWLALGQTPAFAGGSGDAALVYLAALVALEDKDTVAAAELIATLAWITALLALHLSPAQRRDLLGAARLVPALQEAGLLAGSEEAI